MANKIDSFIDTIKHEVRGSLYMRGAARFLLIFGLLASVVALIYFSCDTYLGYKYRSERAERQRKVDNLNANSRWIPCNLMGKEVGSKVYYIETSNGKMPVESAVVRLKDNGWNDDEIMKFMIAKGYCKLKYDVSSDQYSR